MADPTQAGRSADARRLFMRGSGTPRRTCPHPYLDVGGDTTAGG